MLAPHGRPERPGGVRRVGIRAEDLLPTQIALAQAMGNGVLERVLAASIERGEAEWWGARRRRSMRKPSAPIIDDGAGVFVGVPGVWVYRIPPRARDPIFNRLVVGRTYGFSPLVGAGGPSTAIPSPEASEEESLSQNAQLPDQPILKYVHPADRRHPWFGVAVGLLALAGMFILSILGRNFGTLDHLKQLNSAGVWLTTSLIEASAAILALLLAAVALGERIERGVEGPHFVSLIRLTARGGFATIAPAVLFDILEVASTSLAREGWTVSTLIVVQIVLLAATVGAFAFLLASLWATLKLTFVGLPESAPEEAMKDPNR